MVSERIARLHKKTIEATPTVSLDRARLVTKFYQKPSAEPFILRKAHAFEYILKNKKIYIDDDALLVGNHGSGVRSVPVYPENTAWLFNEVEIIDTRSADPYQFLPGEKEELRQIVDSWAGNTFGDYTAKQLTPEVQKHVEVGLYTTGSMNCSTGSHAPDYNLLMKYGYRHYLELCRKKLEEIGDVDVNKMQAVLTWQAMIIVLEALIQFAHRYAVLAEKMAAECTDLERKMQLLTIAENCRVVPENPPQNFHQAIQMLWFTHLALYSEVNGQDHCLGRFDQYMYPFYQKFLKNGGTENEMADLIHELKIKCADIWVLRPAHESQAYAGCPLWSHMFIGGVTVDGKDACNELTDLVIKCCIDLPTKEPCMSFRYHDNINRETLRLALDCVRNGTSHPAFFNDDVAIPEVLSLGFTLKEARDYCVCGCVEPMVPGITDLNANPGYFNPIKVFELAIWDGWDPITKQQVGPHSGDIRTFTCIEDLKEAYLKQQEYFLKPFLETFNKVVSCHAYAMPTITASCFIAGCIEKGATLQQMGAPHRISACAITSIADVADSFAAIEECVFRKKYITIEQLMTALENNYDGYEEIRQILLNKAPKYGNNIESVDEYGRWLVDVVNEGCINHAEGRHGRFTNVEATQSYNVVLGKMLGATPNGRFAYEATADNCSPSNGMDKLGPTSCISSVAFLDHLVPQSGMLLNQRFDPNLLKGDKGLDILETIVRAYMTKKGEHIQINVMDTEVLLAAKKDPKKYQNIIVRVAGYSAHFIDLDPEVQDNIIARTAQNSL